MNHFLYNSNSIVNTYLSFSKIFKPELYIFHKLRSNLPNMRVLDIGVGGGRTTQFLAPLCKEYTGIDYSPKMVHACRKRFKNLKGNINFEICNVLSLDLFKNDSFDLIFFSFNGLDTLPHKDRLQALKEIYRVCAPGGFYIFSSNNLEQRLEAPNISSIVANPKAFFHTLVKYCLLKIAISKTNASETRSHVEIRDGSHGLRLKIYYISPEEQFSQLSATGFLAPKVFSLNTGKEITLGDIEQGISDKWLYYLCSK